MNKKVWSLLAFSVFLLAMAGCAEKNSIQHSLRRGIATPEKSPQVLAVYEPWFGQPDHIDVGYSSHDTLVLGKQVDQAKNLGISGFVVDWYGKKRSFIDESFALLQQVSGEKNFKVALMYDETVDDPERMTENAIANLDYAHQKYISKDSNSGDAYLRYNGQPVIFIWPRGRKTDWARVRQHVDSWTDPPLLIYKDEHERNPYSDLFDGYYAWINPGNKGWQADGSNWGEQYLDSFYSKMSAKYPDKIVVGAAWPGFDDSRAAWTEHRYMDPKCGRTFDETLHYFRRYYDNSKNPLPFLLIATWNDHEEGTAIEHGIANVSPPTQTRCGNAD